MPVLTPSTGPWERLRSCPVRGERAHGLHHPVCRDAEPERWKPDARLAELRHRVPEGVVNLGGRHRGWERHPSHHAYERVDFPQSRVPALDPCWQNILRLPDVSHRDNRSGNFLPHALCILQLQS